MGSVSPGGLFALRDVAKEDSIRNLRLVRIQQDLPATQPAEGQQGEGSKEGGRVDRHSLVGIV